jgi:hypothetical protein
MDVPIRYWHGKNNVFIQIMEGKMGRGILLWLLGVPIPVIIILALLFR